MAIDKKKPVIRTYASEADVQHKVRVSSKVIVQKEDERRRNKTTHSQVEAIMQDTTTRMNDNKGMMELLPDLRLAARVMVSSILSPKDLTSVELGLYFEGLDFKKELPAELAANFLEHFRETYKLEQKLSEILMDSLFYTGSYIAAVLPESTLESMIQSGRKEAPQRAVLSMESYDGFIKTYKDAFTGLGILSEPPKTRPTLHTENLEISDNFNFLKTRSVHRSILTNNIGRSLGMEGYTSEPLITIGVGNGADSERGRNPMVQKWPSDSVLPVHMPSNPKDHLGYFVLVDSKGNIVSRARGGNYLKKLREQVVAANNNGVVGSYLATYKLNITKDSSLDDVRALVDKAAEVIEGELLEQLRDGQYGDEVEVSRPQEVYAMMFSRMLEQKKTRLIYVPKELVTYFAFEYDDLGIGVSLLESTKIFGILRAVLMLAEIMGAVKSAIGTTRLDITVDEDDPNWRETVEIFMQEHANIQTNSLPMDSLAAGDIVKALQKAQMDVNIQGGDFPTSNSEITDVSRNYSRPDGELREALKRQQYSGLYLSPEIVDASMEGDLATLVNSRNLQHAKQVMELSSQFTPMLTDHAQIYTRCSGELITMIKEALGEIEEEATPENIGKVIRAMRITLPEPDMARHRNQGEAYTEYRQFVEEVANVYITEDSMADLIEGDVDSRALESLRISFVNVIMRDWLRRQNLFPEIEEIFYADETGTTLSDRIMDHGEDVLKALGKVMAKLYKVEDKVSKKLEEIGQEEEPAVDEAADGDTGGDSWSGFDGGDEESTGDDIPTDETTGGDEEGVTEGGEEDTGDDVAEDDEGDALPELP